MSKKAKVLIIYTGGTIGMMKTAMGYQPAPGLLAKYMAQMPEFTHADMPAYDLLEYPELLDSANISIANWNMIAKDIKARYQAYEGFIILHGTDTMAYTASALSFMFEHLSKPIILTGSQVPLIEAHTDARENLINALLIAGNQSIPEVCLFFHNVLLRGNRARKTNAYGFNAFSSPNFPCLGEVGIHLSLQKQLFLAVKNQDVLALQELKAQKIAQFSFFPGVDFSILASLIEQPLDALILHSYGVGNAPVKEEILLTLLEKARKKNILVVNISQCLQGTIDMQSYNTGKLLAEVGVLSSHDQTPESVIAKLYYLLSLEHLDFAQRVDLFQYDLRGELTIR